MKTKKMKIIMMNFTMMKKMTMVTRMVTSMMIPGLAELTTTSKHKTLNKKSTTSLLNKLNTGHTMTLQSTITAIITRGKEKTFRNTRFPKTATLKTIAITYQSVKK